MMPLLKLIRIKNLFFIALTEFLIWYFFVGTVLGYRGFSLQLSVLQFCLLVLATAASAAAGYVVNDVFDTDMDRLNRPEKMIIGTHISKTVAMRWYWFFTLLSVALGMYLAYSVDIIELGLINVFRSGILWYYSTEYKRQFFIGNFVVALVVASGPIEIAVYKVPLLIKEYRNILILTRTDFNVLFYFLWGFSGFAFLLTFIREIIKDLQDREGDRMAGCQTLAIQWGVKKSKLFLYALVLLVSIGLGSYQVYQVLRDDYVTFVYFFVAVQVPLYFLLYKLRKAELPSDFASASKLCKAIMFAGVCYSLLFYMF